MDIIRNGIRVLLFIAAIASLVMVGVVGLQIVSSQMGSSGHPEEVAGASPVEARTDSASLEEILLGIYLGFRSGSLDEPAGDDPSPVRFSIALGETGAVVAERLEEAGLISDAGLFRAYMRLHGLDAQLQAGDYELTKTMTMRQIAEALQHARIDELTITVIEGWRAEQIADMLAQEEIGTADEFMSIVRTAQLDYAVLADRPPGASLEGYLFPDTYRISADSDMFQIVERLVSTFDERFDGARRSQAASAGLSIHEVVTLASIVEREAVVAEERPTIAAVYLNRLEEGMYLQADPTVQYAIGYQADSGKWWEDLTVASLTETVSPYNTYTNGGLPPGPICNPSLSSVDAVLNPADVDYLYFLAKGDGSHVFAHTFEEQLENQQLYRR